MWLGAIMNDANLPQALHVLLPKNPPDDLDYQLAAPAASAFLVMFRPVSEVQLLETGEPCQSKSKALHTAPWRVVHIEPCETRRELYLKLRDG